MNSDGSRLFHMEEEVVRSVIHTVDEEIQRIHAMGNEIQELKKELESMKRIINSIDVRLIFVEGVTGNE